MGREDNRAEPLHPTCRSLYPVSLQPVSLPGTPDPRKSICLCPFPASPFSSGQKPDSRSRKSRRIAVQQWPRYVLYPPSPSRLTIPGAAREASPPSRSTMSLSMIPPLPYTQCFSHSDIIHIRIIKPQKAGRITVQSHRISGQQEQVPLKGTSPLLPERIWVKAVNQGKGRSDQRIKPGDRPVNATAVIAPFFRIGNASFEIFQSAGQPRSDRAPSKGEGLSGFLRSLPTRQLSGREGNLPSPVSRETASSFCRSIRGIPYRPARSS